MSRNTLYAYVDGSDLEPVAPILQARLDAFVSSRRWVVGKVWTVNQRHGWETCTQSGDLADWDLGLNIHLPDPGTEPSGWFADIEAVAQFLGNLHAEFGRDFAVGIADAETGITDDLFYISTARPDLERFRLIIGARDRL